MFKNQNWVFFLSLVLFGCANIGTPTGGPKDERPPIMDLEESTENYQTNFKKQEIELVFDEYVELKDVFNQVVISPPLQKRWNLTKKLKSILFEFDEDEVLREDATYTINFGESVSDYTAGNAVEDLRFVFSTGAFIDSMEVEGKVVDALSGDPASEVLVMLYDNLADSVVRTERPFYFAKTDKEGKYTIQNVKSDTFKVFALKDGDLNYYFNQETELIGFPDSVYVLSKNKETIPPISVFLEQPSLTLIPPKNNKFGRVNLGFNQKPVEVNVSYDSVGQEVILETEEDSIKVWYNQEDTAQWNIYVEQGEVFKDTFLVQPSGKANFLEKDSLKRANVRSAPVIRLNPAKEARILFNHPIQKIDSSLVILLEDTLKIPVIPSLELEEKELKVNYRWKENMVYELVLLPNAVTDFYQLENQDTIRQEYQALDRITFGDLILKVKDLDPKEKYVINLYLKNNTNLVASFPVTGVSDFEEFFETIPAKQYLIEIITDLNGNGRWDTGNYDEQRQPEPLFTKKIEGMVEGWEFESETSIKE